MSKELEKAIKHVFDRAREMSLMYEDEYPHITKKLEEDIKLVEQTLKRNEPMKVDLETIISLGIGEHYDCPKCGETVVGIYHNYCFYCGQKLDWSD